MPHRFNAESEIKSAAGVNYTYDALLASRMMLGDGDGNRVQKSNGKLYWYGAGTEILDESDASGNFTDEYVFFGGKRVAHRVVSSGSISYYAEDLLGSSRVITTSTGSVCYEADFYPYGGERILTNSCGQNYKFEGKERDAETSSDDFGARYYSSRLGRWLSADWSSVPAPVPYANLTNPQTLNLYAMVRDNPETFADLDGHIDDMFAMLQFLHRQQGPNGQTLDSQVHSNTSYTAPTNPQGATSGTAQNPVYEQPNANNQNEVELTNVTYNETSGFRANPRAEPGAADSAEQVHAARVAVAEIANRVLDSNHPEREQAPNDLTSRTVHDLNAGNKDIIVAHNDALHATRQALAGSNTTNGAMHFRTGTHKFKSLYGNKATMSFGPFRNAQGGKVYLTVAP